MKYFILIMASFVSVACTVHDEQYYRLHPNELQKAIVGCPGHQTADISCEQLTAVASHINQLVYQLRSNPQAFGKQILMLQETIAQQQAMEKKVSLLPETNALLIDNQRRLKEHLAIVKWLESPASSV